MPTVNVRAQVKEKIARIFNDDRQNRTRLLHPAGATLSTYRQSILSCVARLLLHLTKPFAIDYSKQISILYNNIRLFPMTTLLILLSSPEDISDWLVCQRIPVLLQGFYVVANGYSTMNFSLNYHLIMACKTRCGCR